MTVVKRAHYKMITLTPKKKEKWNQLFDFYTRHLKVSYCSVHGVRES
jgi:hypothetical protein